MFTEEYQVEFLRQYHAVFDTLRHEFLAGEMPWNFADFMTKQGRLTRHIKTNNRYSNNVFNKMKKWRVQLLT